MHKTYSLHTTSRTVTHRVEGPPTPEQVIEFFNEVANDPDFESGFDFISDLRPCGDPNHAFVSTFAREVRSRYRLLGPCRWAMVVSGRGGCAAVNLFNFLTEGCRVEFAPFLTTEEAVKWVDAGTAEWLALASRR